MRKMIRSILGLLDADKEPKLLDHAPVTASDRVVDKDDRPRVPLSEKLADARKRHGRAFKCAAPDVDREVMIVPGDVRIIAANRTPTQAMARPKGKVERLRSAT